MLRKLLFWLALPVMVSCPRLVVPAVKAAAAVAYFPAAGNAWQNQTPAAAGFDGARLAEAVAFAKTQVTTQMTPNFSTQEEIFGKLLGPMPTSRAATNGLVLRHGPIVAERADTERADTERVDPTYSVAKSLLSILLGITLNRGLIRNIHDPVAQYVHDGGYDSLHNCLITWEHYARQISGWEGDRWGENADFISPEAFGKGERKPCTLQVPGIYFEYNDVRINRFALWLLRLWQKSLPVVFKQEVMDPIGASNSWQWMAYSNAVPTVNGQALPSVSGGTRWGGGLRISARDEACFGYLLLRQGRWDGRQIVSSAWVRQATTRGPIGLGYGYLRWLNTEKKVWPDAPATSYAALGAGSNSIWVDPEHDQVIVWRWYNGSPNELIKRVLGALKS